MRFTAFAIPGLPEIEPESDLAALIGAAIDAMPGAPLEDGDVVVVAQKAVSKAEGMFVDLAGVTPTAEAERIAALDQRDPRHVQVVLDEASEVLRHGNGAIICETRHGFVCANAGIDASNVPGDGRLLLLPHDPDRSARELRERLRDRFGALVAVVVTDSFGRAWRIGQCDVAIGCAGLLAVEDERGGRDREGRELTATERAVADELAAAADLARGPKAAGNPVVVVRGCGQYVTEEDGPGARALLRERSRDMFR